MYFHGSPTRLEPGTVVVPGASIGSSHNGACSAYVYMTTDMMWSMSQIHPDDRLGCTDPLEYAVKDAYLWGNCFRDAPTYVHIVEPLGDVDADPHSDTGPAACRTTSARVIAVMEVKGIPEGEPPTAVLRMINAVKLVLAA